MTSSSAEMVAAAIRTVFAQPDADRLAEQSDTIASMLGRQLPKVEAMMREAKPDLLAFSAFPQVHWRQLWSTHPLERTHKENKRRTEVVGVFPNPSALLRLADAVLVEQHDEWATADRRYSSGRSMALLVLTHTVVTAGVRASDEWRWTRRACRLGSSVCGAACGRPLLDVAPDP